MEETQAPTKRVLIVTGAKTTKELWKPLAEKYDLLFWVPDAAGQAAAQGITNVAHLGQFITPDVTEKADAGLALVTARVVNAAPRLGNLFAGAYGTAGPEALRGERIRQWWPGMVLAQMRNLLPMLAALESVASQREIAGLVTHEDLSLEFRALTLWAKAKGLPTIHVPHAPCHLTTPGGPDIHRETRAEWVAASGPHVAQFYAANGHAPDHIYITGAPHWDYLATGRAPGRDEARRVLGLPTDALVMGYSTTWWQSTSVRGGFDAELTSGFHQAIETAQKLGAHLVVTMHPGDNANNEAGYAELLRRANVPGLVTRHHLLYVLRAIDVLVTQSPSNLCIEAAMLGTPSVYIQTEGFDYATPLPLRVPPGGDLAAAVLAAKESTGAEGWQALIKAYHGTWPEPEAAQKTAEFVMAVVG